MNKNKNGIDRHSENEIMVYRLCIGSADLIRNKKDPKGLFYYMNKEGRFVFWDRRTTQCKEKIFDSIDEMRVFLREYLNK